MPATRPCKGGHGRVGEEEVGGGGDGEEDTQLGGEDCERGERERDSDGEEAEEEEMESLFITSSPWPFFSSASRDGIR